jgi:hypothetical protein
MIVVTTCEIVIKRITNQNGVFSGITRHNIFHVSCFPYRIFNLIEKL